MRVRQQTTIEEAATITILKIQRWPLRVRIAYTIGHERYERWLKVDDLVKLQLTLDFEHH